MGISGEVAGKPGGAELAGHLRKVENSQPDAIRQIGQRWRRAATSAGTTGQEISRAVSGLDGAWQGGSADAFVGCMGKLTAGFDKASQVVETSANAIDRAAQAVETAKNAVNAIGERALADATKAEDACAKAVAEDKDDEEAKQRAAKERDDTIIRAMQDHAREAQTKIAEADAGLNGALGALNNSSGGLSGAFSKLPKANEQAFTQEWEFTPPAPAVTNQQAAGAPGAPGSPATVRRCRWAGRLGGIRRRVQRFGWLWWLQRLWWFGRSEPGGHGVGKIIGERRPPGHRMIAVP